MFGHLFGMPITGVARSVSDVGCHLVGGMGAWAVLVGLPYPGQSTVPAVGPGAGCGYGAAGALGGAGVDGVPPDSLGQATLRGLGTLDLGRARYGFASA